LYQAYSLLDRCREQQIYKQQKAKTKVLGWNLHNTRCFKKQPVGLQQPGCLGIKEIERCFKRQPVGLQQRLIILEKHRKRCFKKQPVGLQQQKAGQRPVNQSIKNRNQAVSLKQIQIIASSLLQTYSLLLSRSFSNPMRCIGFCCIRLTAC